MSLFHRLCLAVAAAAFAVFVFAPAPACARDANVDAPALWRIDGPKGDVYLLGSIHLLPQGVNWRAPALDAALNKADVVAFEVDLDDAQDLAKTQQLVTKLGLLPPGATLRALLKPGQRAKLERIAASINLPAPALDPMRPWLAALTVGVQWIVSKGYDPGSGVDQQIWNWTKQAGKKRQALETAEDQLGVFAGLTREHEITFLEITLDQIDQAPKMLNDLVQAWRKGDTKALDKLLNEGMEDFPVLNQRLLDDRHAKWLPQIEKMIGDGRTHVVVVGTAHLIGKSSIVALLRAKGVKVEGP